MRIISSLLLAISLSASLALAEDPPGNLPDIDQEAPGDNDQNGNLNTNKQDVVEDSYNRTYNGQGAGSQIPVSSAISPSIMSNGSESCLQSGSSGMQLVGIGLSRGKMVQDPECNRRRNASILANVLGMKVAAISLMCQDPNVYLALLMSATPCPVISSGRLRVGKSALVLIKSRPDLYIPDYAERTDFYNEILGVGEVVESEEESAASLSDRFRASKRDGDR